MEGDGQAGAGQKEVDGIVEGTGRRMEGGDLRVGGCRSRGEVTGGPTGNRPSRVAVRNLRDSL